MLNAEMKGMWRPASGEYRFSLTWLAELVGRAEATVGQRRALGLAIYDKGAEHRGKARCNTSIGEVQKDNAWGVAPEYIESVMEAARKWAEYGSETDAELPKPRRTPTQLDRIEQKIDRLEDKLDSLLQILDK